MKKAILTVAAAVALSTQSAFADVTNPVDEAKAKDWMTKQYPLVEVAMACNLDTRFDYLEAVMKVAYVKADAYDTVSRDIVDMWWTGTGLDVRGNKVMKFARVAKRHSDHPEVVKGCAKFGDTVKTILAGLKQAAFSQSGVILVLVR